MAFVVARCTNCGANIEVDDNKEADICCYCGAAFITQKVIHNHNTFVTKHIYGKGKAGADEHIARGETFLKLKDWDRAIDAFEDAAEAEPSNYKTWLGLVRAQTENFTDFDDTCHVEHYRKALAVANNDEKKIIKDICDDFILKGAKYRAEREEIENTRQNEMDALKEEKQAIYDKLHKQSNLFAYALGAPCIFITIVSLFLSFLFWQLLVPIGVVFLFLTILFLVLSHKASVKRDKVGKEILEMQQKNNLFSDVNTVFKNFFL